MELGNELLDFDGFLKSMDLDEVALQLTDMEGDDNHKSKLDRFLDFVFLRVQLGYADIVNLAYPTKRMMDKELEKVVIDLINNRLYPEIIMALLKNFTRNLYESDTNLYIANLIESKDLIKAIFDTFKLIQGDIFIADPEKRILNVKRIQQMGRKLDKDSSSPLDTAARFKYILEFFAIKMDVSDIYTLEDIRLYPNSLSDM